MAIMHFRVSHVSRSTGRSSVQSAAYITGEKLYDERTGQSVLYKRAADGIYTYGVMAPPHAASEFQTLDGWNQLEKFEDAWAARYFKKQETCDHHKNSARLSMNIIGALPRALTLDQGEDLVRDFVQKSFVDQGHYVTYAIHHEEGNPHVHMMISHRFFNEKGEISEKKNRDLCTRLAIKQHRQVWADVTNQHLERHGIEARVSEKSYVDLGIDLLPTVHEGWYAQKLARQGTLSILETENQRIREANQDKILENPLVILDYMTKTHATFTVPQLVAKIRDFFPDNEKAVSYVYQSIQDNLVTLGEDVSTEIRFTSKEYQDVENKAIASFKSIKDNSWGSPIPELDVMKHIYAVNEQLIQETGRCDAQLNQGQRQAIEGICASHQVSVLVGRAGAGKTTALRALKNIFEAQGCQVVGSALSASAAKNLGDDVGCFSETVRFYCHKWEALDKARAVLGGTGEGMTHKEAETTLHFYGKYALTEKSVFLVDEASMIGMRDWQKILKRVEDKQAKLVIVGDGRQFSAIEAGDMHRYMEDTLREESRFVLSDINRQKEAFMKEASIELSHQNVHKALSLYENAGHVIGLKKEEMLQSVAADYVNRRCDNPNGVVLAYTNDICQSLNKAIRSSLQERGMLCLEETSVLGIPLTPKDSVVFLNNHRKGDGVTFKDASGKSTDGLFIRNGTRGVVESIVERKRFLNGKTIPYQQLTLKLSETLKMTVDTDCLKKGDISHGYALTIHKSQGQTVDWSLVVSSQHMDARAVNVAMTRHRYAMTLYYSHSDFASFGKLQGSLGRASYKDLASDYPIQEAHKVYFNTVESYRLLTLEMAEMLVGEDVYGAGEAKERLKYLGETRAQYGRAILEAFDKHALYVLQAKLTKEKIEITCGIKERPLSQAEKRAKQRINAYSELAKTCRTHLEDLKKSVSRPIDYESPRVKQYEVSKATRDSLALEIAQNKPLHKAFMGNVGYGMNVIEAQARYALYRSDFKEKRAALEHNVETYKSSSDFNTRGAAALEVTKSHLYEKAQKLPNLTMMLTHEKQVDPHVLKQDALDAHRLLFAASLEGVEDRKHAELLIHYGRARREVGRLYGTPASFKMKEQRDTLANELSKLEGDKTRSFANLFGIHRDKIQENKKTLDKTFVHISKERETYQQKGVSFDAFKSQQMSLNEIESQLKNNITALAEDLFHGEKVHSKTRAHLRFGANGSKCVMISGPKQGVYSDFETGEKGNAFKLIGSRLGLSFKDAIDWAQQWLGNPTREQGWTTFKETQKQADVHRFVPLFPAPKEPVDIQHNKFLNYVLKEGKETHRFAYLDGDKNLLGYVVRIEKRGDKVTLPLTYCKDTTTGKTFWKWKGFGKDAPLYGGEQLTLKPTAPVLVVEGEKAANAAKEQFPTHAVVSWPGGASAVKQAYWEVLKGRDVVMWPDKDKAGFAAAQSVREACEKAGVRTISIVRLPSQLPEKWDLADAYPKDFDKDKAKDLLEKTVSEALVEKQLKDKIDNIICDDVTDRSRRVTLETVQSLTKTCESLGVTLSESDKNHLMKQSLFISVRASELRQNGDDAPNKRETLVDKLADKLVDKLADSQKKAFLESVGIDKTNERAVTQHPLTHEHMRGLEQNYHQSISQIHTEIQKLADLSVPLSKAVAESIVQTVNLCPALHPHLHKLIKSELTKVNDVIQVGTALEKEYGTAPKDQVYRSAVCALQTWGTPQQAIHKVTETLKADVRDVHKQIQMQQQQIRSRGLGV